MLIVNKSVKSLLSQKIANQFTAMTVMQPINLHAVVALDLEEIEVENHLLPHVMTVDKNANCLSNQLATNQFTAKTALQTINLHAAKVLDLAETIEVLDLVEKTDVENHLLPPVMTVDKNVNYHLNQLGRNQFTATTVLQITNRIFL